MITLIRDWKELSKIPESDTHYLEIEDSCGWIIDKNSDEFSYLSSHTFYGSEYKRSTKRLQDCGFNIELANWDGDFWRVSDE